ncbi:MAG: capsular polysaccharide biosynthesis protein [Phycisphaerae bacterium]|nr:MAG: capsular polysaccharide biosynthesis protein [Phycisphaerae bacterium]
MREESKHSILLLFSTGVTALLTFIYSLYAMNVLGPARAADFVAAISVATFFYVALGPINGTVAKFTAAYAAENKMGDVARLQRLAIRNVFRYGGICFLLGSVGAFPLASWLQYESVLPLILSFAIVWLTLLLSVARGMLRGLQRFGPYSINTVTESLVRLIVGVGLLSVWTTTSSGVFAFVIALIVILAISQAQMADIWRQFESPSIDSAAIVRYLKPMCVMMAITAAFDNVDMIAVKHLFEAELAGVYGAAFTLARGTSVLVTPFNIILLPLVAGLQARRAPVRDSILRICGYFVALCAVPLVVFAIFPKQVLTLVRLDAFIDAAPLLLPLTAARLLGHLNGLIALSYAALGRFGFLKVLIPALVVEVAMLTRWHDSHMTVIYVALFVQAGTLLALAAYTFLRQSPGDTSETSS